MSLFPSHRPTNTSIEFVQSKSGQSGASDAVAATYDAGPIQGNLLVAVVMGKRTDGAQTFNTPSGWTLVGTQLEVAWSLPEVAVAIFFKTAGAAEGSTVTITAPGDWVDANLIIGEWSGLFTPVLDQNASNDETSGTGLVCATGTTSASTVANALAVAICNIFDDDFNATSTSNWSGGYTQHGTEVNSSGSVGSTTSAAFKILTATGVQSTTLTFSGGDAEERASFIAVFKE